MVEFAILLPVFLLLVFGIVDWSRYMIGQTSIDSVAREAARYGSAVGDNGSGVLRYVDCDGIRNAGMVRHSDAVCPSSKLKLAIARLLAEEGFLGKVRVEARDGHPVLVMELRYDADGEALIDGIRRVSRPGRRVYVSRDEIPKVRSGLGLAVISTSNGILSDRSAREASIGGELVCEVW